MARIGLRDGSYMVLRDDLTTGDIEKMNSLGAVFDEPSGQWRDDPFRAAIESVGLLVEEWTVADAAGNPLSPTPDSVRGLSIQRGREIIIAVTDHIKNQGFTSEDLAVESGT